jgi:hypothetical protein
MLVNLHPDLESNLAPIKAVRDAVEGSVRVKQSGYTYLPHPSEEDKTSLSAQLRYKQYLAGAEWDGFPEQTERTMIGRMNLDDVDVAIPSKIDYLVDDFDGDGLSLAGAMKQTSKNILEAKWHLLLADYEGLTELDTKTLSIADVNMLNPRAKVKQYARESVVDWHFDKVFGVNQLAFVMLQEIDYTFDQETRKRTEVVSYLVLALDEAGYYQQKLQESDGILIKGDANYIKVNQKPLKFIPVQIASDLVDRTNSFPTQVGFLNNICQLAYHSYRMSADYKEAMRLLPPTTHVYGVSESDWETFQEINDRSYVGTGAGATNVWPSADTKIELVGADTEVSAYERYFDQNRNNIKAVGGTVPDSSGGGNKTAEQVSSESAEQNALLVDLAGGLESAFKRIIAYCGMFEGLYAPEDVGQNLDDITLKITREFNKLKLSYNDLLAINTTVLAGNMSQETAATLIYNGGWGSGSLEQTLTDLQDNQLTQ